MGKCPVYDDFMHIHLLLQVKFVMSDETQLADLLVLNLHNFEDEVSSVNPLPTNDASMCHELP